MNYVSFTFVEVIHEEQIGQMRTYQRRRNDGFMPQPALMPDPSGLLFSQIHSAMDRVADRAIQAIFHPMLARQEAGTRNLTMNRKPQPLTSTGAKQTHNETVIKEIEKNNVNESLSSRIYI